MTECRRLALVLGDQLSFDLASLRDLDPTQDAVLLAEVAAETDYVPHHPQKIALLFSAMRHFAEALRQRGWRVHYVTLDDPDNSGSLPGELRRWAELLQATEIHLTECGEWRLELRRRESQGAAQAGQGAVAGTLCHRRHHPGRADLSARAFQLSLRHTRRLRLPGHPRAGRGALAALY